MAEQPLFPLRTVLFPDGLLELKIFEARYLDLMSRCLREQAPFGVVALCAGSGEARSGAGDAVQLYEVGTFAELRDVDSAQAGLLLIRCRGTQRFMLGPTRQELDGLWLAEATPIPAQLVGGLLREDASAPPPVYVLLETRDLRHVFGASRDSARTAPRSARPSGRRASHQRANMLRRRRTFCQRVGCSPSSCNVKLPRLKLLPKRTG